MITTTAAIVDRPGAPFTVGEVALDGPRPNEVLVRMVATGLCHTDLGVQAGGIPFRMPGILGHEGAGIVERTGNAVTKVRPGDKVLLTFTSCGHCAGCRGGHPAYCHTWLPRNLINGTRDDGTPTAWRDQAALGGHFFGQSSFAELSIADERSVVRVDPDADLATLAPLGCAVQTGFGAVWNVLRPAPGQSLAVFGAGAVGLTAIIAANTLPLGGIIAVDRVPERLQVARELGATHTIDTTQADLASVLADITGGHGIHHAIDTTGVPSVLRAAVDALGIQGTCAVVGAPPAGTEVAVDIQSLLTGKRIVGVTLGDGEPHTLLPQLVSLHQHGALPVNRLIKHYKLEDINTAADDMRHGNTIKPVILFSQ
jgi:aryl-alcohol dehydrogenase